MDPPLSPIPGRAEAVAPHCVSGILFLAIPWKLLVTGIVIRPAPHLHLLVHVWLLILQGHLLLWQVDLQVQPEGTGCAVWNNVSMPR